MEKSPTILLAEEFAKLEAAGCDPRIVEALRELHGGLFCASVIGWHADQPGSFQDGIFHVIDSVNRNRISFEEKALKILRGESALSTPPPA